MVAGARQPDGSLPGVGSFGKVRELLPVARGGERMVRSIRAVLVACSVAALAGSAASAAEWEATGGDLGRDTSRFALRAGARYGTMKGSEIENTDPSRGFDAGVSARVFGAVSVFAGYALDRADVDGQVLQLLDQNVRADGRSGTVKGEIETKRFRAGVRLDAYRERDWRFLPYFLIGALYSTVEARIDEVDGAPPVPIPSPDPGEPPTDISTISNEDGKAVDKIGGLAGAGFEFPFGSMFALDVHGHYEAVELEAGTNSILSVGTGIVLRF
jgi:opacity protein-like surface antigen